LQIGGEPCSDVDDAAHQRRAVETAVPWSSVRQVTGRLTIGGDGPDDRRIERLGDLARPVRLPLTDNDHADLAADVGAGPSTITKGRHVDARAHYRTQTGVEDDCGDCAALHQRCRQTRLTHLTTIDDDVDVDVGEPIERFGEIWPDRAEMRGTPGLGEAGKEKPAGAFMIGERYRLVDHHLSQRSPVTVGLGHT